MNKVGWPYFDPDFDNLRERIYGPTCRVVIDNESMEDCMVVKVDSVKKQGLLLEVVQILTDMNLTISKSYISSDAGWFMDVFHVTDEHGNKLTDQRVINYIQQGRLELVVFFRDNNEKMVGRFYGLKHGGKALIWMLKLSVFGFVLFL